MSNLNVSEDRSKESLSLVDLAKILVWRKYYFLIPFLLMLGLGSWYLASRDTAYSYVSYYSVGMVASDNYLEPINSTILAVTEVFYPNFNQNYERENGVDLNLELIVTNPKDTAVIKLMTIAPEHLEVAAKNVHESLIHEIDERQSELFQKRLDLYEFKLNSINRDIENLDGSLDNQGMGFSKVSLWEKRSELKSAIEEMSRGQKVITARKSDKPAGLSKVLLAFGVMMLSLFSGVLVAYTSEFIGIVRRSIREDAKGA